MTQALAFTSWGKGELSPFMRGRVDLEMYYSSAETLYNMIVRPEAIPVRRAGTHYVAEVVDSTKDTRLIDFVFSADQSYIIEMGEYYFLPRDADGNLLTYDLDTVSAWLTTTKYYVGEVVKHRVSAGADYRYFVCLKEHMNDDTESEAPPRDAEPINGDHWEQYWGEWEDAAGDTGTWTVKLQHPYTEAQLWDVDYAQKKDTITLTHQSHNIYELRRFDDDVWAVATEVLFIGPWEELNEDDSNRLVISGADVGDSKNLQSRVAGGSGTWDAFTADDVGRYFRVGPLNDDEEAGVFLATAYTDATRLEGENIVEFKNTTQTADWSRNAFYEEASTGYKNYPAHVTYHEGRLVFANTPDKPQGIWFSKSFIYRDFNVGGTVAFGFDMEANTAQGDDIKWIASAAALATGSFGAEFSSPSPADSSLNNDNKNIKEQSSWGSDFVRPVKIGSRLYYVQRTGRKLREYYFSFDVDNYESDDMTELADHITISGVVDMAYQRNQDSLLWCVLDNGKMAIMSRKPSQELKAWSSFETDGDVKSIRFIPKDGSTSDRGFMIVERTIDGSTVKYIEYFDNHVIEDDSLQKDCYYVDCGVTSYTKPYYSNTSTNALTITDNSVADATYTNTASNALTVTSNPSNDRYIAATVGNDLTVTEVTPGVLYTIVDSNTTFTAGDNSKIVRFINTDGDTIATGTVNAFINPDLQLFTPITGTIPTGTVTGGLWGFSTEPIVSPGDYILTADSAYPFGAGDVGKTIRKIDGNGDMVAEWDINTFVSTTVLWADLSDGTSGSASAGKWDFDSETITYPYTLTAASAYFDGGGADDGKTVRVIDGAGDMIAEFDILDTTSTTVVECELSDGTAPASAIAGKWDFSTESTTKPLGHLEGETVQVFADSLDRGTTTVANGAIAESYVDGYTDIAIGLQYYSLYKSNPLNSQTPSGTAKGKIKCIDEVAVEVYKSLEMDIGSEESNLYTLDPPETESTTAWFTGLIPDVNFDGRCDNTGYIIIKQSKPYPLNILGIYPRVQISEG